MSDQTNTQPEQPTFEPSGVPEDVSIELPFPMLVATVNDHAIVCKIQKNQFFTLAIVELFPKTPESAGRPLDKVDVAFGPTPLNTEVGAYWQAAIQTSAHAFYENFSQKNRRPRIVTDPAEIAKFQNQTAGNPTLAVLRGGKLE